MRRRRCEVERERRPRCGNDAAGCWGNGSPARSRLGRRWGLGARETLPHLLALEARLVFGARKPPLLLVLGAREGSGWQRDEGGQERQKETPSSSRLGRERGWWLTESTGETSTRNPTGSRLKRGWGLGARETTTIASSRRGGQKCHNFFHVHIHVTLLGRLWVIYLNKG
jgi:hypothetical protein